MCCDNVTRKNLFSVGSGQTRTAPSHDPGTPMYRLIISTKLSALVIVETICAIFSQ